MNKLGIFMNFWENDWDADHIKYIEKAKKTGFDVLEFQAQPMLAMSNQRLLEIRQAAKDIGIELTYSLGLDQAYDISSESEAVRTAGIRYLRNIMEKVAFMEGKIISGVSYAGWGVPNYPEIDKAKLTQNSVTSMKEVIKSAESYGIIYGIEAVNRFEGVVVNTAKEAVDYVEAVGSKNIGVLLDTYHMNIEEFSFREAIHAAGKQLVGLHTGGNNRCIPGRDHINWDEIFQALSDVHFTGRIVSEPFVRKGGKVGRDIYVWRDLVPDTSEDYRDSEAREIVRFETELMKKYKLGE